MNMVADNVRCRRTSSNAAKILLSPRLDGCIETLAFVLPHIDQGIPAEERDLYHLNHIASIDEIEAVTDLDFLPSLALREPLKALAVEGVRASALWATQ